MRKEDSSMVIDCAIIGGGPAGLSAALVLGRARRTTLIFDDNQPRNAVTHETHGFLTRDAVKPDEFRALAHQDISKYPSVAVRHTRITEVRPQENQFELVADDGEVVQARTVILATGMKETLPEVDGIHNYYGKSLFSCPYCDGWELRDKPLIVIAEEGQHAFHLGKLVWNWSRDLVVCTNGHTVLTEEQKETLQGKGIQISEDRITALVGENGMLERVQFSTHAEIMRQGGFVATHLFQAADFGTRLGCKTQANGKIVTDMLGRTSIKGVYAAGEALGNPSQLIIAAAQGSAAAGGVNTDLTESEFS
jgi:thioredoxin reductase